MWYEQSAQMMEGKGGVMEGKGRGVRWAAPGGRPRCFSESGEGAAALLSVLGRGHQLQDTTELAKATTSGYCRGTSFPKRVSPLGLQGPRALSGLWRAGS